MGKKIILWGGGLIALYLVVVHYTGASKDLAASGNAASSVVKAFQGR